MSVIIVVSTQTVVYDFYCDFWLFDNEQYKHVFLWTAWQNISTMYTFPERESFVKPRPHGNCKCESHLLITWSCDMSVPR